MCFPSLVPHGAAPAMPVPAVPHNTAPPQAVPFVQWGYVPIPRRLLVDLRDSPVAVALFALIARRYRISAEPVPLSLGDLQAFDPTLRHGAAARAVDRLITAGWLHANTCRGCKTRYMPTWGRISGQLRLWSTTAPTLGRPRHVDTVRLDQRLLDTCIGRIEPHPRHQAQISRYVTTPLLGLRDVGSYALGLGGFASTTSALSHLGLVRGGCLQPLPDDATILALVSQPHHSEHELTAQGWNCLGLPLAPERPHVEEPVQPLFFVPPTQIGQRLGALIGGLIGCGPQQQGDHAASGCAKPALAVQPASIPCKENAEQSKKNPPSGGGNFCADVAVAPAATSIADDTASLLRAIHVRPQIVAELAQLPRERVVAAVADGRSRLHVRDLAGWVVSLLRDGRDHGWQPAPSSADPAETLARMRNSGLFSTDASDPAVPVEPSPIDLADRLREGLRMRTAPALWPTIAALHIRISADEHTLWVGCASAAALAHAQASLEPLVGLVLRACGGAMQAHWCIVSRTEALNGGTAQQRSRHSLHE